MQTFLPHASFAQSAAALDTRRLGKQIIECKQILSALAAGPGAPWYGHPAVQMWRDHTIALAYYGMWCGLEWERLTGNSRAETDGFYGLVAVAERIDFPPWLHHAPFHAGHRGHLYRKDPQHYAAFSADADAPLLYPYLTANGWVYVERVAEGRFRLGGGPVRKSVKEAANA